MSDEPEIAALREEIRRAGAAATTVRLSCAGPILFGALGLAAIAFAYNLCYSDDGVWETGRPLLPGWVTAPAFYTLLGVAAVVVMVLPLALLVRALLRAHRAANEAAASIRPRRGALATD